MASTVQSGPARHRPGGRTAQTTRRINDAVLSILVTEGVEACTFGRVAARAGIQRSTLYRRFADRWAMILNAYLASAQDEVSVEPTGDFEHDFRILLSRFAANFATPIGAAIMRVVLSIRGTAAQVHLDAFFERRMEQIEPMFAAAIQAGKLDPQADRREIVERAAGAVIFRLFFEGRDVDAAWIDRMAADITKHYGRPGPQAEAETAY